VKPPAGRCGIERDVGGLRVGVPERGARCCDRGHPVGTERAGQSQGTVTAHRPAEQPDAIGLPVAVLSPVGRNALDDLVAQGSVRTARRGVESLRTIPRRRPKNSSAAIIEDSRRAW
jgi:hypothetical protein